MVELAIEGGMLVIEVKGVDRLLAARRRIEVPLGHVRGARFDPDAARRWPGVRAPGTHIPFVVKAGTFYSHDQRNFWDVHHPERAIVIDLEDETWNHLVVEVADPEAAVKLIEGALHPPPLHAIG
jgi:hypothetical protein